MTLDPNTAKQIGEIHSDVKHLLTAQEKTDKRIDNLNCGENKEKISEMYNWYSDQKNTTRQIKNGLIKNGLTLAIGGLSGVIGFMGFRG